MATKKKSTHKRIEYTSFKKSPDALPFLHFRYTPQTTYWLIIGLVVLALASWVLVLTMKVHTLYDQVDIDNSLIQTTGSQSTKK